MPRRKLPYQEGYWIAVPLPKGGWAAGVIARAPRAGKILFGYFFATRFDNPPALNVLRDFKSSQSAIRRMFGDLALLNGRWRVIGRSEDWNRDLWPVTTFVHYDGLKGRPLKREYQ